MDPVKDTTVILQLIIHVLGWVPESTSGFSKNSVYRNWVQGKDCN